MLMYFYLFALVLGGVILGASMLLGGGGDHDAGDHAGEAEIDGHADAGHGGGLDAAFSALRSTRFWMFFLAFFGLTGVALDGLGLTSHELLTLGIALGMGVGAGATANAIFKRLGGDAASSHVSSGDYIGRTARVLVPVRKATDEGPSLGKVRVQLKGSTVDLLAVTDEDSGFDAKDEALIVEMDGTKARIARMERK